MIIEEIIGLLGVLAAYPWLMLYKKVRSTSNWKNQLYKFRRFTLSLIMLSFYVVVLLTGQRHIEVYLVDYLESASIWRWLALGGLFLAAWLLMLCTDRYIRWMYKKTS